MPDNHFLDFEKIKQLAATANIDINDSELAIYQKNLDALINLISQTYKVDTQNIAPMTQL